VGFDFDGGGFGLMVVSMAAVMDGWDVVVVLWLSPAV
jgi:hypothetical protein